MLRIARHGKAGEQLLRYMQQTKDEVLFKIYYE